MVPTSSLFYVGTANDFTVTTDTGSSGLSTGDTVTWNPGPSSALGAPVPGLIYGTTAFGTINAAIHAAASTGDSIKVGPGTFPELVEVNKSVSLLGNQMGVDARSGRPLATEAIIDGRSLGGAVSVQANNVTVDGFTIQGDSSFVTGLGAGITTVEATTAITGLHVLNNIVQNVPVGISPSGNLAVIQNNLVQNAIPGSDDGSIVGNAGLDTDRGLTNALIDSNTFVNNSDYSIHITVAISNPLNTGNIVSNNVMDSELDLSGNVNAKVTANKITNSSTGGITLGGSDKDVTISNNEVLLGAVAGISDGFGAFRVKNYGNIPNTNITVTNNIFLGGALGYGVHVDVFATTGTLTLTSNQIAGSRDAILNEDSALAIDASGVYWGTSNESTVAASVEGAGSGRVDFSPLLDKNESASNANVIGFQPDMSSVIVHTLGAQMGPLGRITEAIGLVASPGTVVVHPGTYTENVNVNKAVTLAGTGTINGTLDLSVAGASLGPGIPPATSSLIAGPTSLAANTMFTVTVNGSDNDASQLIASNVNLNDAVLNVSLNFVPALNDSITLIRNTGTQVVRGTFHNLFEGSLLQINGSAFQISYHGGSTQRDVVLTAVDPNVQQLQMSYKQGQLSVVLPATSSYTVTVAGNRAFYLHGDLNLNTNGNYFQNSLGQQEIWVQGSAHQFGNPWYFILPNGNVFAWNGSNAAAGVLVASLPPLFYYHPELLTSNPQQEHLAFLLKQTLNLSFTDPDFDENYGGAGERWVRDAGSTWYFILPNGKFYLWDGTLNQASGTFLAQLTPDYYTEVLARLVNPQANQYSATIQGGNTLVINAVANFIGEFFIKLSATQGQSSTPTIYHVQVTNSAPVLTPVGDLSYPTAQITQRVPLTATDADPGDTATFTATAGNAGYVLGRRYGLNEDPGGFYYNANGQQEVWYRGYNKAWYFIRPNGQFFQWDGRTNLATSTYLTTVAPIFWDQPLLLSNGQPQDLAYTVKQTLGLSLQGSLYQNTGGQNEKWLYGAVDGGWYFIKPDGSFYRWDGQAGQATGFLLTTFSTSYWADPTRLYQAPANQIAVSVSGAELTVNTAVNFIGDFLVLVAASDSKRSSLDSFAVQVTP